MAASLESRLRSLLVQRALGPRHERFVTAPVFPPINRRQFLGSTFAVTGLAGARDPLSPYVTRRGRSIRVHYGGTSWRIDAALFGDGAVAGWSERPDQLKIWLSHAWLPGTDLRVDFVATLTPSRGGWGLRFAAPFLGFDAHEALGPWMRGESPLNSRVGSIAINAAGAQITGTPSRLALTPEFDFRFQSDRPDCVSVRGTLTCRASALHLRPLDVVKDSLRELLLETSHESATHFALSGVEMQASTSLGFASSSEFSACVTCGPTAVSGELFSTAGFRRGVALLEGAMRAGPVQLEHSALLYNLDRGPAEMAIAGRVARRPYALDAGSCQLTICGDDERPFYARVHNGQLAPLTFQARLERAWLPLPGVDAATISFPNPTIDIHLNSVSPQLAPPNADENRGLVLLGSQPYFVTPLNNASLRIRRGTDLFDLTFAFTNFHIRVEEGNPYLVRSKPPVRGGAWPPAKVVVTFPPQHITEHVVAVENPSACSPPKLEPVSRSRLSAPSRVAFVMEDVKGQPHWKKIPLTIEALTEWSELALAVNSRALEPDASFDQQLDAAGIKSGMNLDTWLKTLGQQMQPPKPEETALVMTGRLIVSPSSKARLMSPRRPINRAAVPLWHARLDTYGRGSVRALWSNYLVPGRLGHCSMKPGDRLGEPVLTEKDHWNIVGQTSVYALPALRRIVDPNSDKVDDALKKMPRSRVIRPDPDWPSLLELDDRKKFKERDSGVAIPQPFNDADIILTSIGGTFVADWQGEPPLLLLDDGKSFGLERLLYHSQLGRDIRVEAVYKGYTLPHGQRCSYLRLSERRFFPHPEQPHLPIAYMVQRSLLVFGKPEKRFPGVNQPYGGRDFPAGRMVMLTRKTADLKKPGLAGPLTELTKGVRAGEGGQLRFDNETTDYTIFWPRTADGLPGTKGDVEFKWAVDDGTAPITSNLMFVENAAVIRPALMQKVVAHYRALVGPRLSLRTARVGGTRCRYAAPSQEGDTSFDTEKWILSVQGRRLPPVPGAAGTEAFEMDGRMEGSDQPPFYPVVERAFINVQSLDRLVGSPQGLIQAAFNQQYIEHGFGTAENKSDLYLNVLGPDIVLDVTGQGGATGGLAKPNALVVAISRKIGLVGGRPLKNAAPNSLRAADLPESAIASAASPAIVPPPYDFTNAAQGTFSPDEFFGALGNAKLLGLIPLSDVLRTVTIDGAPKLVESIAYRPLVKAAGNAVEAMRGAFQAGAARLQGPVKTLLEAVNKVKDPVRFVDLYPRLHDALTGFDKTLDSAITVMGTSNNITTLSEAITATVSDGKALVAEIERTLQDPVPAIMQGRLNELAASWATLKDAVNGNYAAIGRALQQAVGKSGVDLFCKTAIESGIGSVLFGVKDAADCEYLVENPRDAFGLLEQALFAEVFARPLADMLARLRDYRSEVTAEVAWGRRTLERTAEAALDLVQQDLKARLKDPIVPSDRMLLAIEIVAQFSAAVDSAVKEATSAAGDVRAALDAIDRAVADRRDLVEAAIEAKKHLITAKQASDLDALIRDFKQAVADVVVKAARDLVVKETSRVRQMVLAGLQQARAQAIERIVGAGVTALEGLVASAEFARVVDVTRSLKGWCELTVNKESSEVLVFADLVANRILSLEADVQAHLQRITDNAALLQPPPGAPPELRRQFELAVAELKVLRRSIADAAVPVAEARLRLQTLRQEMGKHPVCSQPQIFMTEVQTLLNGRRGMVARLKEMVAQILKLDALLALPAPAAADPALSNARANLTAIVEAVTALMGGLTSITQAGVGGDWAEVKARLAQLQTHAATNQLASYRDRLVSAEQEIEAAATELRAELLRARTDMAALERVAGRVLAYAVQNDKQVAALVLQTVALADNARAALEQSALSAMRSTASQMVTIHEAGHTLLEAMLTQLNNVVVRRLVNEDVVKRFAAASGEIKADLTDLQTIAKAGSLASASEATAKLLARWRRTPQSVPPLVGAITALADLAEHLLSGNLGSILDLEPLRGVIREFRDELAAQLRSLVPTSVRLRYDWSTRLEPVPADKPIFKMAASTPSDLTLSVDVLVDVAANTRDSTVAARMARFDIILLGDIQIATIHFSGASFVSRNGAAPSFSAEVSGVTIGPLIQFLEPLQKWLSPGDSGFYIRLLTDRLGIEAGYAFDAGIITLGGLSFINVALDVSAQLPLSDYPALFKFQFASAERPFLISAPPYGGGGHLVLVADSKDIVQFELSFMVGAVIAIKFGPLRAQGRVVAGIFIFKSERRRMLVAFVEAAGEGQIACFGISVCLQIGLRDDSQSGKLEGFSRFTFSFKMGFIRVSFTFEASYTIKNSGGGITAAMLSASREPLAIGATAFPYGLQDNEGLRLKCLTPRKGTEWAKYRQKLAVELLKD